MTIPMWTIEEGIKFVRWLEPKLAQISCHCALTGGAIFKGESQKDLDIIVYPHDKGGKETPINDVWADILEWCKAEESGVCGGVSQVRDAKEVRWLSARGKRIDFFFLS